METYFHYPLEWGFHQVDYSDFPNVEKKYSSQGRETCLQLYADLINHPIYLAPHIHPSIGAYLLSGRLTFILEECIKGQACVSHKKNILNLERQAKHHMKKRKRKKKSFLRCSFIYHWRDLKSKINGALKGATKGGGGGGIYTYIQQKNE